VKLKRNVIDEDGIGMDGLEKAEKLLGETPGSWGSIYGKESEDGPHGLCGEKGSATLGEE
jgi:hypothetical protein